MRIAGIDPGKDGAIAIVDTISPDYVQTHPMPLNDLGEWCPWTMLQFVRGTLVAQAVDRIIIEACHAFPGIGAGANAQVMKAYGMWLTALATEYAEAEVRVIPAQTWKRAMGVILERNRGGKMTPAQKTKAYKAKKQLALAMARAKFPYQSFRTLRGRDLDGHAEAALIALFGVQVFEEAA